MRNDSLFVKLCSWEHLQAAWYMVKTDKNRFFGTSCLVCRHCYSHLENGCYGCANTAYFSHLAIKKILLNL